MWASPSNKVTMWDSGIASWGYCPPGQSFIGGMQWALGVTWTGSWTNAQPLMAESQANYWHTVNGGNWGSPGQTWFCN